MYKLFRHAHPFFDHSSTAVLLDVHHQVLVSSTSGSGAQNGVLRRGRLTIRRDEAKHVVGNILHMNVGDGEHSYSKHSLLQEIAIKKAKPVLEEAIKSMLRTGSAFPKCFNVVDLGCSSGPNTLLTISYIIDAVYRICQQEKLAKTPDFQVFLNDLPGNDCNTVFKSLPVFYEKLEKEKCGFLSSCFISGLPGSFYGRLFPNNSLHFVHSSYSIHWLSKVPDGLMNKGNIYMAKTSCSTVHEAYLKQYRKDFHSFLRLRSQEMVSNGRMVIAFIGRTMIDPSASRDCCYYWEILAKCLYELVDEGLIEEDDIDLFNVPIYTPHEEEVREIVEIEGSFTIDRFEMFQINNDPRDNDTNEDFIFNEIESGKNASNYVRAGLEPIFTKHFGASVIDSLFSKYAKLLGENWLLEKAKNTIMVISLTKH
ncbi:LOW QUALITY PROTEIN: probable methyltransferase TCM_000331 [Rutidosis leptorrhynchoides]|uniref:LOW QUALITY PROTEIN: probable methyltransferase TCM_000331 n=1 Tax=Rutidosis leptorrhynchoides TaxID=125765 RepID=UPI003A9970B7